MSTAMILPTTMEDLTWSKHKPKQTSRHYPGMFGSDMAEARWGALIRLFEAEEELRRR